jgi:hypothetical protein
MDPCRISEWSKKDWFRAIDNFGDSASEDAVRSTILGVTADALAEGSDCFVRNSRILDSLTIMQTFG